VLALLTALVSVLVTGGPSFFAWFQGGVTDLHVVYDRDDQAGGVILTAYNGGDIPAHIKKISLTVPLKNAQGQTTFDGHAVHRGEQSGPDKEKQDDEDYFLLPNTHKFIKITFDLTTIPAGRSKEDFDDDCTLHFEAIAFHPNSARRRENALKSPPDEKIPCTNLSVVGARP
jgi:hypothetical protein